MSHPHRNKKNSVMDSPDRWADRPATAGRLDLSGLAYECESLVIRDPLLPQALVRALLDAAIALREEGDRRRQN